jgi:hypothetical protein
MTPTLVDVGGRFMTGAQMATAAEPLGMAGGASCQE